MGIGTRLIGRMVRHGATRSAAHVAARAKKQGPGYIEQGRRLREGSRRFGRSMWHPFAHATRILWLEVTGIFFGVFTVFFGGNAWRLRADWASGHSHTRFILYSIISAIFLYFAISSFIRAGRHNRAQRKNQ